MFQQRERGMEPSSTENTPSSPQPGRLKSPFLFKQPYEPEPSRSPVHQASPVCATETRVVESHTDYEEPEAEAEYEEVEEVVNVQRSSHAEQQQYEVGTEPENLYEDPQQAEEQNLYEDTGDRGTCARALYDYQA
ncbi:drebrin-like b isoform X1, partial [Tachysurus ichikawai]